MTTKNRCETYTDEPYTINKAVKIFKKFNAYDRYKDRKDKQLYDYEDEFEKEEELVRHVSE